MSSSYVWETHQQSARMRYGFARYMLLRPILMDARSGSLDPNWREHLTLDALGYPPEARLADSNKLALLGDRDDGCSGMGDAAVRRSVYRSWLARGFR